MDVPQSEMLRSPSFSSSRRPPTSGSSFGNPTTASSSPLPSRSTSIKRRKPAAGVETSASTPFSHSQAVSASSGRGSASGSRSAGLPPSRFARERASTGGNSSGRRLKDRHTLALESIRHFLKGRSSYDMLPVSFRLIVLDTQLVVGPALDVMWGAGVVSAPLWHSIAPPPAADATPSEKGATKMAEADCERALDPASASAPAATTQPTHSDVPSSTEGRLNAGKIISASRSKPGFAGMLTVNDIIHLIQYYYHHASYDTAKREVETFRLEGLRDIEATLSVPPPPLLSCHPLRPLLEACQLLMKTHARRLPLLDYDEQTGIETVVSVLTQYRILKFIAMNCRETASLHRSIRSLGVGTYVSSYRNRPNAGSRGSSGKIDPISSTLLSAGLSGSALVSPNPPSQPQNDIPPVPSLPVDFAEDTREARSSAREGEGEHSRCNSQEQTPKQELSEQFFNLTPFAEETTSPTHTNATPVVATDSDPPAVGASTSSTTTSTSGGGKRTIPTPTAPPSSDSTNPYHPIYTATLDTTVFDVVHMFSERGISAVPIVDEEGNVVDMYETVDVITLVRSGAYQDLDLTIRSALTRRPADFPGVYSCSPEDSVANIFALLRRRRVHRLLIVEPEHVEDTAAQDQSAPPRDNLAPEERSGPPRSPAELEEMLEKQGARIRQKRGKLVGILALSDLLRHIIGIPASPGETARRRSSDGMSATVGGEEEELPLSSSGPPFQPLSTGAAGPFVFPLAHSTPASLAPNLSPAPGAGGDTTIIEGVAVETTQVPSIASEEVDPLTNAADSSASGD